MNIDLSALGWKAFQDLCAAVAAEVLSRPIQVFLPSKDGGRDGAFVGTWDGAPNEATSKSTIQCKFTGKSGTSLSLANLKAELSKVEDLSGRGLAHDYIIMTNAGVSGSADAEICAAFEACGAKRCRIFGRDWIVNQIQQSARLRMMVPRVYGIGDLAQILDDRAYTQARYILSAMGDDLGCFVTTSAHRQSVSALTKHGFVLLLGDPASGKSTIAATLALGALDSGSAGAVRITSPDQLSLWNPNEKQFLWVDDAFGPNQYDAAKTDAWNPQLPVLKSALKQGAKIVFTSRNYIWESARRALKTSQFPLFAESRVVIDVQGLAEAERAQILYNHVKLGDQPKTFRTKLKPLLTAVTSNRDFLPEIARRFGSPTFTRSLRLTEAGVKDFVERPLEFLKEIIERLDRSSQAAIALIFLHGQTGLPSPVVSNESLEVVIRLLGVELATIARSLEALNGSLTLLLEHPEGRRWTFRHPTIADAFAALVAESPELVELYVRGAKVERLTAEVVCGSIQIQGAKVRVPHSMYDDLMERLKGHELDRQLQRFLTGRCDEAFLRLYMKTEPELAELVAGINSDLAFGTETTFFAKLNDLGLLSEAIRSAAVAKILDATFTWVDAGIFYDKSLRSLLTRQEFVSACNRFKSEFLDDIPATIRMWSSDYTTTDEVGHFQGLREQLERAQTYFVEEQGKELAADFAMAFRLVDERIDELEREQEDDRKGPEIAAPRSSSEVETPSSIFDDVDEM